MSVPQPMPCHIDECPHPFRCHSAGSCIEARRDSLGSWSEALSECRKRGVIPESWRTEKA